VAWIPAFAGMTLEQVIALIHGEEAKQS